MADPMAMLDMEKRTGIKNTEIDDFVKKTDALQKAIAGLADGSVEPSKVSLKKYGILTPEEQAEEDARREKNRQEMAARVTKEKAEAKVKETEKWWSGAEYMFGPREGTKEYDEEMEDERREEQAKRERRTVEEKEKMVERYSMDYSRWNDSSYIPDDPATKAEVEAIEKKKEDEDMAKFEADNSDWCKGQMEDIEKRNAEKRKRDKSAESSRIKGNKYFGMKKYEKALNEYAEALEKTPYKPNILTNMALTHSKLKQWADALEFCDRALHCDKKWVKALCRRATVVVEQAKDEGGEGKMRLARVKALKDLERASVENPENKDVLKLRDAAVQEISDEGMERRVREMVEEEKKRRDTQEEAARKTNEMLGAEATEGGDEKKVEAHAEEWVKRGIEKMARGEGFDEPLPVGDFEVVDKLVERICNGEVMHPMAGGTSEDDESKGLGEGIASLLGMGGGDMTVGGIMKMNMTESVENRVYLRTSRGLEKLCQQATGEDEGMRERRGGIFGVLAEAVKGVKKNKLELYEKMGLAAAIACLYEGEKEPLSIRVEACKVLASVVDDDGGIEDKSNSLVCGDVGIIMSVSGMLEQWVHEGGGGGNIVPAVDLLRDIAKNSKTQAVISVNFGNVEVMEGGVHPVGSLVRVMTRKGCTKELRECVVCALSNLALIESVRETFVLGIQGNVEGKEGGRLTSAVQALLATSRAHKTETAAARVISLGTLMNACVGSGGERVKSEIVSFGGVPILVALATSAKANVAPGVVKQRAAGLLGRVVTVKGGLEAMRGEEGGGVKLGRELVRIVLKEGNFEASGGDPVEREREADTVCQLVRSLAVCKPSPSGVEGYVSAIVRLLPEVKGDSYAGGKITATSVCRSPLERAPGSAAGFLANDKTLVANAMKCIIVYLDGGSVDSVLSAGGLERLVCVLANHNSYKEQAVRKNAAAAIARVVKGSEEGMKRCRELRGMEILVELGRGGKV